MKPQNKNLSIDLLILALAGVTLLIAVVLLIFDNTFHGDSDQQKGANKLGKINQPVNDVRRRPDGGLTWSTIHDGSSVYEGDAIFTGDASSTTVIFNSEETNDKNHNNNETKSETKSEANTLILDAGTLVVISHKGSKTQLDLQQGSLIANIQNSAVELKSSGETKELSAQNASVQLSKGRSSKTSIKAVRGEFKLRNSESKAPAQVVKINESIVIKKGEVPKVLIGEITPLSPKGNSTIWIKPDSKLVFDWSTTGAVPKSGFILQVTGEGENFHGTKSFPSETNHIELDDSQKPLGRISWRVTSAKDSSFSSPASIAHVFMDLAPKLISPSDNQILTFDVSKSEKGKSIEFSWSDVSASTDFTLEVGQDQSLKNLTFQKDSKAATLTSSSLPSGYYFWRVTSRNPNRKSTPTSQISHFEVKAIGTPPDSPILKVRQLTYEIPGTVISRMPASLLPDDIGVKLPAIPPIEWSAIKNAATYDVSISNDSAFGKLLVAPITTSTGATHFSPNQVELHPGHYFLRVQAKDENGLASLPSETVTLDINLPAPIFEPLNSIKSEFKTQEELAKAQAEFKLKWTRRPWTSRYQLEVGTDDSFKHSKVFELKTNEKVFKLSNSSQLVARVRTLGRDGTATSLYSKNQVFHYDKKIAPAAIPTPTPIPLSRNLKVPALLEPSSGTRLVSIGASSSYINFSWQTVKDAKGYTLQLSQNAEFDTILFEKKLREPGYALKMQLPSGTLYWRVRAEETSDRNPAAEQKGIDVSSAWSAQWNLQVLKGK
jgi:hypothetical protein